jgi:hypothetical protein
MKFFEDQNILTDYQHGFRKKRSCELQLITTIHDLPSGINSSTQRVIVEGVASDPAPLGGYAYNFTFIRIDVHLPVTLPVL